jgi:hypothetical protein
MLFDWLINLSTSILCFFYLYPLHQPDPVNIVTKVFTDWQGLVTWCSQQQLGLTAYEEGDKGVY